MSALAAVVLAPPMDSYPPLRVVREDELLPVVRVEACDCGERIQQLAGEDVTTVVARHNERLAHRAWRGER
jgi:hypothetical protein